MRVGTETLLVLLIFALYLKDCLLLLDADEAVLVSRGGARWGAAFGARTWKIAGKEPLMVNPLRPDRAAYRLRWRMAPASISADPGPRVDVQIPAELARVGYLAWITWFEMLVLIPAALMLHLGPAVILAAAALLYLNIAVTMLAAWRWRRPLGIGSKAFAVLALECILCAPYCANLVRRLAAARCADEDFELAAHRLLGPDELAQARAQCLARIDDQLERIDEGDVQFEALQRARGRFLATEAPQH